MDVYYRFLNCGFRLPVSAGSASGVKASPLGYCRVYVKLEGPFEYGRWFRNLKAGRSFATNGPMLLLTVDGKEPGDTIISQGPKTLRIRAEARSARPLDHLEIIANGRVVKAASGSGKIVAELEMTVAESAWITARCFERPTTTIRFAHTSPVYIDIAGQRMRNPPDAQFFADWLEREIKYYQAVPGFKSPAHRQSTVDFFTTARAVYTRMLARGN